MSGAWYEIQGEPGQTLGSITPPEGSCALRRH